MVKSGFKGSRSQGFKCFTLNRVLPKQFVSSGTLFLSLSLSGTFPGSKEPQSSSGSDVYEEKGLGNNLTLGLPLYTVFRETLVDIR